MKITKKQLRRIIKEALSTEVPELTGGRKSSFQVKKEKELAAKRNANPPRSVQADYDIANKEDTFPAPKEMPEFIPRSVGTKQAARMIRGEFNKVLSKMPGFQTFMQGQGSAVDAPLNKVLGALKPVISKIGLTVDEQSDEAFIYYDPAGVEITLFGDRTGTTEVDFGDL